jgi:poly-gamma-glutamate synthesis protein (capsule biosynthesis protein)
VGDVNIQRRENPAAAFTNVRATLSSADLRYANLEGLYGQTAHAPIRRKAEWRHSDPAMIDALTAGGFDVVGCANNVCFGEKELLTTLKLLDKNGILHCGAGATTTAARAPAVIKRRGTTVGFLQYTARYYGEEQIATETSAGVARLNPRVPSDIETVIADVKALREKVDVLIFSHHLRKSGRKETETYQREVARAVVKAGADLVFGHGGHVNQGIEIIDGTPVLHCIANFAFDWWKMKGRNDGLLLRLIVRDRKLVRLSIVPVCRDEKNNVYLTPPASTEGARQIKELRESSPGVPLRIEGQEIVVPLGQN